MSDSATPHNWISRLVERFLRGNLSALLIVLALAAGVVSLALTAREEDPQIVVPVADVIIRMPGASAREVERMVSTRLEKLLYQIDGVEHVYSTSYPSMAVVTVRFYVGEDRERSWVKLQNKVSSNIDQVPPGVTGWVVKPVEIDDVPVVCLTLYSDRYSDYELRRMAEEMEIRLQSVKNAGRTYVVGGRPREILVHVSPQKMAGRGVTLDDVSRAVKAANVSIDAGEIARGDRSVSIKSGRYLETAREVGDLIVSVLDQKPVYLKEVADVRDGPAEPSTYVRFMLGPSSFTEGDSAAAGEAIPAGIEKLKDYSAVTVAVAKRRGTNAVWVSREAQDEAKRFAAEVLPSDVHLRVTRDTGATASEKVNGLVESLLVAIAIVVALLAWTLGWREGLIIALAVPLTFGFTLLVNMLAGYTINRVTLFALILSLGLVIDDPIVDVENIHRHFAARKHNPFLAVILAVNEVRPPIIFATLAVIVSFIPLFFITGMMGPYMAPMALNVPVAMLMSLLVAFTVTPWLAYRALKSTYGREEKPFVLEESLLYRFYAAVMGPVFRRAGVRFALVGALVAMLAFTGWLVLSKRVPLKMLPFDNKNEFQVVVDMPEGATLEETEGAAHAIAGYLVRLPEATDVTSYAGCSSPMDFNGMIRHYYLRSGANVADVRFNMVEKKVRAQQSHAVAMRVRNDLKKIAKPWDANIKIVETPPGPPVIETLVAEVTSREPGSYEEVADASKRVRGLMESEPGVVDVDDTLVAPETESVFVVDRQKASLHGITEEDIATVLAHGVAGDTSNSLRLADQVNPVRIEIRLTRSARSFEAQFGQFTLRGTSGEPVFFSELGAFEKRTIDQPIYHKNLRPVVYVFGDTAGLPPPEAVLSLEGKVKADPQLAAFDVNWAGEGEWEITLRVFRDLGIAFGVAVLGIYVLLLYQTNSYLLPAIQLIALPLSVIGIMPGFWALNALTSHPVDGWADPVYFTATGMIGMIALSGIATRNAILLVEFVEVRKPVGARHASPDAPARATHASSLLVRSLIEAGALRTRPILLTSFAAMLGAWPITLDPIFSGLAWALIFGLFVSTLFTLVVVPMVYYLAYRKHPDWNPPPA